MAMRRRSAIVLILILATIATLAYLRDPGWVGGMTSGLRGWETNADGTRYRWTGGRASLFVPADARTVTLPVRATFDAPNDWPVTVTIGVDGKTVETVVLTDGAWRRIAFRLPRRGSRKHRRIDIHADRARAGERAVQIGEVELGERARELLP